MVCGQSSVLELVLELVLEWPKVLALELVLVPLV